MTELLSSEMGGSRRGDRHIIDIMMVLLTITHAWNCTHSLFIVLFLQKEWGQNTFNSRTTETSVTSDQFVTTIYLPDKRTDDQTTKLLLWNFLFCQRIIWEKFNFFSSSASVSLQSPVIRVNFFLWPSASSFFLFLPLAKIKLGSFSVFFFFLLMLLFFFSLSLLYLSHYYCKAPCNLSCSY